MLDSWRNSNLRSVSEARTEPPSRLWLSAIAVLVFILPACLMESPPPSSQSRSSQGSWSKKTPLPILISENTVAAVNNKIFVIGGSTAERVDQQTNFEYDIATDRWHPRAPLPTGMTHAAATGLNGKIFVVGAFTQTGHGGAVGLAYEYDPVKDSWRTLAPMKSPRGSVGVTVLNGKIHAVGGRGVDKITVISHEVNDPATNRWEAGAPLPTARSGIAGAIYKDKVIVAGGECRDKKTFPEFEAYDVKTGRWAPFAPMSMGHHGFGGVVVGNSLYFAGGGGRTNELLVFNLPKGIRNDAVPFGHHILRPYLTCCVKRTMLLAIPSFQKTW